MLNMISGLVVFLMLGFGVSFAQANPPPDETQVIHAEVPEQDVRAQRSGITGGLGLGLGMVGDSAEVVGFAGAWKIGVFVRPDLAILLKSNSTLVALGFLATYSHGVTGVTAQYWPDEHIYVEGGVGVSTLAVTYLLFGDAEHGMGLQAGAGYEIWREGANAVSLGWDLALGAHPDALVFSHGLTLGWQYN